MGISAQYLFRSIPSGWFKILLILFFTQQSCAQNHNPVYPPSTYIKGITFNFNSADERAPGSDNWAVTWAANDHQYTSWGDGGGFGGTNDLGRVSIGVGRIEGDKDDYQGYNVWGGNNAENPAQFDGKSVGIICIDGTLWMWRNGNASETSAFLFQELHRSTNYGASWQFSGVRFDDNDFSGFPKFFAVTFCQFGRDYEGARDNYVYMYAPETFSNTWEVQYPGNINLIRVLKDELGNKSSYSFFAGFDNNDNPIWSSDVNDREPVFEDEQNGVMRTSVSYNAGLQRYLLTTQQVSRFRNQDGHIGIYEAPEPWGPWYTVLFDDAWDLGLQTESKTVFWNFSNKWASADGKNFVMVMTGLGEDNWGSIEGTFITNPVDVNEISSEQRPDGILLHQNYPNPFNPATTIKFEISSDALVEVNIFDLLGNKVKEVFKNFVKSNEVKEISFDAENLTGGVYFYEIMASGKKEFRIVKKMVLLK